MQDTTVTNALEIFHYFVSYSDYITLILKQFKEDDILFNR